MQIGIYFYFELLSLLTVIIFYIQKRDKIQLYFIPFLFATVIVEIVGLNWVSLKAKGKYPMYNIFTMLEFLFYGFLFYKNLNKPTFKKIVLLFIPSFAFLAILNMMFIQGINITFNTYTFLLGSFFIVVFCCLYFYESVLPDQIDQQLSKQPFFWVCSGLLIYYLGSVIINALFEYLINNDLRLEGQRIYKIINHSLNVILYSSFCIAFYLCPNHKKISSSQS